MLRSHLALGLTLTAVLAAAAPAAQAQDRYALANGCYGLKSLSTGSFAAKTADGGFAAGADQAKAERFRMQATDLGRYLLYGKDRDFLANGTPEPVDSLPLPLPAGSPGERIQAETAPSESGDWSIDVDGGAYVLTLPSAQKVLAAGGGGALELADRGAAGDRAKFGFEPLDGCADYPEAETNVTGEPTRGATAFGEVSGFVDAHMHMMAFEFLGGRAHCGRPWDRYGVATALRRLPRPRAERRRRGAREHALATATRSAPTTPSAGRPSRTGRTTRRSRTSRPTTSGSSAPGARACGCS